MGGNVEEVVLVPSSSLLPGPSLRRWVYAVRAFYAAGSTLTEPIEWEGDGNPATGLKKVGRHEDNLSKFISSGTAQAFQIAYQKFPDAVPLPKALPM